MSDKQLNNIIRPKIEGNTDSRLVDGFIDNLTIWLSKKPDRRDCIVQLITTIFNDEKKLNDFAHNNGFDQEELDSLMNLLKTGNECKVDNIKISDIDNALKSKDGVRVFAEQNKLNLISSPEMALYFFHQLTYSGEHFGEELSHIIADILNGLKLSGKHFVEFDTGILRPFFRKFNLSETQYKPLLLKNTSFEGNEFSEDNMIHMRDIIWYINTYSGISGESEKIALVQKVISGSALFLKPDAENGEKEPDLSRKNKELFFNNILDVCPDIDISLFKFIYEKFGKEITKLYSPQGSEINNQLNISIAKIFSNRGPKFIEKQKFIFSQIVEDNDFLNAIKSDDMAVHKRLASNISKLIGFIGDKQDSLEPEISILMGKLMENKDLYKMIFKKFANSEFSQSVANKLEKFWISAGNNIEELYKIEDDYYDKKMKQLQRFVKYPKMYDHLVQELNSKKMNMQDSSKSKDLIMPISFDMLENHEEIVEFFESNFDLLKSKNKNDHISFYKNLSLRFTYLDPLMNKNIHEIYYSLIKLGDKNTDLAILRGLKNAHEMMNNAAPQILAKDSAFTLQIEKMLNLDKYIHSTTEKGSEKYLSVKSSINSIFSSTFDSVYSKNDHLDLTNSNDRKKLYESFMKNIPAGNDENSKQIRDIFDRIIFKNNDINPEFLPKLYQLLAFYKDKYDTNSNNILLNMAVSNGDITIKEENKEVYLDILSLINKGGNSLSIFESKDANIESYMKLRIQNIIEKNSTLVKSERGKILMDALNNSSDIEGFINSPEFSTYFIEDTNSHHEEDIRSEFYRNFDRKTFTEVLNDISKQKAVSKTVKDIRSSEKLSSNISKQAQQQHDYMMKNPDKINEEASYFAASYVNYFPSDSNNELKKSLTEKYKIVTIGSNPDNTITTTNDFVRDTDTKLSLNQGVFIPDDKSLIYTNTALGIQVENPFLENKKKEILSGPDFFHLNKQLLREYMNANNFNGKTDNMEFDITDTEDFKGKFGIDLTHPLKKEDFEKFTKVYAKRVVELIEKLDYSDISSETKEQIEKIKKTLIIDQSKGLKDFIELINSNDRIASKMFPNFFQQIPPLFKIDLFNSYFSENGENPDSFFRKKLEELK